ncbi:cation diffusion facilitator family transporter [Kovacikia minuta CCNUW1]|uniref:cation diffusion facilitator family transporter n=1 Tax=Kovacikia minuta TaxID=2931930 RepID=UPI001CCFBF93|nr:cation diffusion facilitator family transporter [Kovacikia minuta]UBF27792.1 cation diffusion facilitator family transporter [Kovacikia minuta CCNUW1]
MHQHIGDGHHSHSHETLIDPQTKRNQLATALLLIGGFAVAELGMGLFSHSLALIAESGHMASDSLALILALLASWLGQSSQSQSPTNHRLETTAALINGIGLTAIALWIGWESIDRLHSPATDIASLPMLLTAVIGVIVNGVNVAVLHRGSDHDLNLKGAFLHVLADLISSIGVILAAISIATLHWLWADGAVSLLVAILILLSAIPLIIESVKSLLNRA